MRIIPAKYECELCRSQYETPEDAIKCESRGRIEYPIGCIYGDHTGNGFYKGITFAVAGNSYRCGHMNDGPSWACRDNGYGDSLGDSMCAGNSLTLTEYYRGKLNFQHPTFIRMVNYLKSANIPITIWDGEKAVPYDEKFDK